MSLDLFSLEGRTALVTGSSRGLGRAMAEGLAAAGAAVVLNGSDQGRLAAAAAEMEAAGRMVHQACFDVTDEAAVVATFERLDRDGVAIDILVNNAGIQLRKPMVDLATDEWRRVIEVNLTSAFVVGREAARRMIPRGRGKIVNIGSLTSELARATVAPYTVAKGGIKMLTRAMAAEWAAHGIQANAIGPGYMLTDMNRRWSRTRPSTPGSRGGPRPGAGAGRTSSSAPRCSWRRRRPTTSTARSSTSTAGCWRCSEAGRPVPA
jgi:gluconate 5-dehydrogenase